MPAALRVISSDLPESLRPVYVHIEVVPYVTQLSRTETITHTILEQQIFTIKAVASHV